MGNRLPDFARVRQAIRWATPGQFDAGFAALATFITGVAAVRDLSTESLAAYALLNYAYRLMNQFPTQLVFSPSQIIAIDSPVSQRLGSLAFSIPRGVGVSLVSALFVPLGVLVAAGELARSDLIALSTTATMLAVVFPIQDHVRSVFHMSGISWMAAATSFTNFVATGVSLLALYSTISWAVFGSLLIGNIVSLVVAGIWILRRRPIRPPKPTMRDLYALGGWLFITGLQKRGTVYGVTALLGIFAGLPALGFIEAARVVAQPVEVFSRGLMNQIGPWLTEAGSRRNRIAARRWSRRLLGLLAVATLPYLLLVARDWSFNPFALLTPRAYEIPGLVAASLVVIPAVIFADSIRLPLLGARKQKAVALVTFVAGLVQLGLTPTGIAIGAFAAPLASAGAMLLSIIWFLKLQRDIYQMPLAIGPT